MVIEFTHMTNRMLSHFWVLNDKVKLKCYGCNESLFQIVLYYRVQIDSDCGRKLSKSFQLPTFNLLSFSNHFNLVPSYRFVSLNLHNLLWHLHGSISPTFYARLFCTKVLREAFLYLDLWFVCTFLAQKYRR